MHKVIIFSSVFFISYLSLANSIQSELHDKCELIKTDILVNEKRTKRSAPSISTDFWEDGKIYYTFNDKNAHEKDYEKLIESVMKELSKIANITFIKENKEDIKRRENYITINRNNESECNSHVGPYFSKGKVNLDPKKCKKSHILHEFMHTLGFNHEHQRFDRDSYINIHRSEVKRFFESKKIDKNVDAFFDKFGKESIRFGEYDYDSIMHYGSFQLSKDDDSSSLNQESYLTVTRKDGINEGIIRKPKKLSARDKRGLQFAYPERCAKLRPQKDDELSPLKTTLCQIANDVNLKNTSFVSAYSNLMKYNIQFSSLKGSYQVLDNGAYRKNWYLESADWIVAESFYYGNKKAFAFGEVGKMLNNQSNKYVWGIRDVGYAGEWGIWDVRFVGENGKVLKANPFDQRTQKAYYVVEANLGREYVAKVYGAFLLPVKSLSHVYFLKKDGTYDLRNLSNQYKNVYDVNSNKFLSDLPISELFPMIPSEELEFVDFIQKFEDKIILYKKVNNKYVGYYIVNTEDIINKTTNATVPFIHL